MNLDDLEPFASRLALEWDLSECEHDDLLSWGETLAMCDCLAETVRVHMEIRAEVLRLVGSEAQEMYDGIKQYFAADEPWYEEGGVS